MIRRTKVIVLTVLALVAATAVAVVVWGQTEGATAAGKRDGLLSKVAANLGVSVEELVGAFLDARLEMIDEAVAAGRITEEQAQAMKARIEARQALREVLDQAVKEGKITPNQLTLLRGRAGILDRGGGDPRGCGLRGRMPIGRMMRDRKAP